MRQPFIVVSIHFLIYSFRHVIDNRIVKYFISICKEKLHDMMTILKTYIIFTEMKAWNTIHHQHKHYQNQNIYSTSMPGHMFMYIHAN